MASFGETPEEADLAGAWLSRWEPRLSGGQEGAWLVFEPSLGSPQGVQKALGHTHHVLTRARSLTLARSGRETWAVWVTLWRQDTWLKGREGAGRSQTGWDQDVESLMGENVSQGEIPPRGQEQTDQVTHTHTLLGNRRCPESSSQRSRGTDIRQMDRQTEMLQETTNQTDGTW